MNTSTTSDNKPLLIYDGECGYCNYTVDYWKKLTNDQVNYKPYQDVADEYPDITIPEFQQSIQYIGTDGERSSAAKASFLTLSHADNMKHWLWLYRYIPGFAFISELIYKLVSRNRNFFYFFSRLLWGKHPEPATYAITSWLLIRALGIVFLIAFYSFYTQALGLIGSHGIIPIADVTQVLAQKSGPERFWLLPMVFWLNASDLFIQATCLAGILFSCLLIINLIPRISLVILIGLYLSLIYAGQFFMAFQWDLLLVEAGYLGLILLCARTLGIWLFRWLLFRFMFVGGFVKVMSGDSSWWDLTALNYHFFTQPLPTPIAWYAQQLPEFLFKSSTAITLIIELCIVFLIFFPRRIRFFSGYAILLLQFAILLTGNYNFFNITTIILCLSLYDDAALKRIIPARVASWITEKYKTQSRYLITTLFVTLFAIVTVTMSVIQFCQRFNLGTPNYIAVVSDFLSPLRLVSTYGPFAVMTKERHEIIVEGSNDGLFWYAYEFKYKPGNVNRPLKWNIPFQPRLDWQMWFAALDKAENTPWIYLFITRLLENSQDVTALLEFNPFSTFPPRFIRSNIYNYEFTDYSERWETGAIWKRKLIGQYTQAAKLNRKN